MTQPAAILNIGVNSSFFVSEMRKAMAVAEAQVKGVNLRINENAARQPLGRITSDFNQLNKSLEAATARVVAFSATLGAIGGTVTLFKQLISTTIEVEKHFREINSVFNLSTENLQKFRRGVFDSARDAGQAFQVATKAALEFSRQGLTAADTLDRVTAALRLTRLSGVEVGESIDAITSAINGFNREFLTANEIVNKLVSVDTRFAVSAKDLAAALERVGSTAQDASVDFNKLLGLITSARQITGRDGAVIGNALKSIFTRIVRPDTLEQLESLNIAIKDFRGNILPADQLLQNLAKSFGVLSQAQKQSVVELTGGVFQINQLTAILNDLQRAYNITTQATNASSSATNELIKRNEVLNQGLSTLIQNAKTTATEIGAAFGSIAIERPLRAIFSGSSSSIVGEFGAAIIGGLRKVGDKNPEYENAGEAISAQIGEGLARGFGNVLLASTPVIVTLAAKLGKLITSKLFEGVGSLTGSGRSEALTRGIDQTLNLATAAELKRFRAADTVEKKEAAILAILNRQAAVISATSGARIQQAGLFTNNPTAAKTLRKLGSAAEGYLPDYVNHEQKAIRRGVGGATPAAKPVVIPNFNYGNGKIGTVVANTDEYMVPNYAHGGTAIFNRDMVQRMGLPPGAQKITAAGGYIPNFNIPPYKIISQLGGSTGAALVEDATGKRYVKKFGNSPAHVREEFIANRAYSALGVPTPKISFHEGQQPFILSEFVQGKTLAGALAGASAEQRAAIKRSIQGNFVSDALLANWDVTGLSNDNIIINNAGQPIRVDLGGSLRFRAQGAPKNGAFGPNVTELQALRNPNINRTAADIFGGISDDDIKSQIISILAKEPQLLAALPPDLQGIVSTRLKNLRGQFNVAGGYIPNFNLLSSLGSAITKGAGSFGKHLPKTNLPANVSEEEIEKIYQQYARMMYDPKSGKIPIDLNLFANKAFQSSVFENAGSYVLGHHDGNVFLPTHLAPTGPKGAYSAIKELKNYDNVLFAVTQDLSKMLGKAGYHNIASGVDIRYRGTSAKKDIFGSSLKTPLLAANLFSQFKAGHKLRPARTDGIARQFNFPQGSLYQQKDYLAGMGLDVSGYFPPYADGYVPNFANAYKQRYGNKFSQYSLPKPDYSKIVTDEELLANLETRQGILKIKQALPEPLRALFKTKDFYDSFPSKYKPTDVILHNIEALKDYPSDISYYGSKAQLDLSRLTPEAYLKSFDFTDKRSALLGAQYINPVFKEASAKIEKRQVSSQQNDPLQKNVYERQIVRQSYANILEPIDTIRSALPGIKLPDYITFSKNPDKFKQFRQILPSVSELLKETPTSDFHAGDIAGRAIGSLVRAGALPENLSLKRAFTLAKDILPKTPNAAESFLSGASYRSPHGPFKIKLEAAITKHIGRFKETSEIGPFRPKFYEKQEQYKDFLEELGSRFPEFRPFAASPRQYFSGIGDPGQIYKLGSTDSDYYTSAVSHYIDQDKLGLNRFFQFYPNDKDYLRLTLAQSKSPNKIYRQYADIIDKKYLPVKAPAPFIDRARDFLKTKRKISLAQSQNPYEVDLDIAPRRAYTLLSNEAPDIFGRLNMIQQTISQARLSDRDFLMRGMSKEEFAALSELGESISLGFSTGGNSVATSLTRSFLDAARSAVGLSKKGQRGVVAFFNKETNRRLVSSRGRTGFDAVVDKLIKSELFGFLDLDDLQFKLPNAGKFSSNPELRKETERILKLLRIKPEPKVSDINKQAIQANIPVELYRLFGGSDTLRLADYYKPKKTFPGIVDLSFEDFRQYLNESTGTTQPGIAPFGFVDSSYSNVNYAQPIPPSKYREMVSGPVGYQQYILRKKTLAKDILLREDLEKLFAGPKDARIKAFDRGFHVMLADVLDNYTSNEQEVPFVTSSTKPRRFGKLYGISNYPNGYIPSFASIKPFNKSDITRKSLTNYAFTSHRFSFPDSGSYLNALDFSASTDPKLSIDYLRSFRRGDAYNLFTALADFSRERQLPIHSSTIAKQIDRFARAYNQGATGMDAIYALYPQLKYRDRPEFDTTFNLLQGHEKRGFTLNQFKSQFAKKLIRPEDLDSKFEIEDLYTYVAKGYIPNYISRSGLQQAGVDINQLPEGEYAGNLDAYKTISKFVGQADATSFAKNNALGAALQRESKAVNPSQIYIDSDPRLKGPTNPLGLLVANRRDEPIGGFQGVNRVIGQGRNPKLAGAAKGHIPNFADTFTRSNDQLRRGSGSTSPGSPISDQEYRGLNALFDALREAKDENLFYGLVQQINNFRAALNETSSKKVEKVLNQAVDNAIRVFINGRNQIGRSVITPPREVEELSVDNPPVPPPPPRKKYGLPPGSLRPQPFGPNQNPFGDLGPTFFEQKIKHLSALSTNDISSIAGNFFHLQPGLRPSANTRDNNIQEIRSEFERAVKTGSYNRELFGSLANLAQAPSLDETFMATVQKEIAAHGRSVADAMDIATKNFLAAGGTLGHLAETVGKTTTAATQYAANLKISQKSAGQNALVRRATELVEEGKTLKPGSKLHEALLNRSAEQAQAQYLEDIGKTSIDELTPQQRIKFQRVAAGARRRTAEALIDPISQQAFDELKNPNSIFGNTFTNFDRRAEDIIKRRNLKGANARRVREQAAGLQQSRAASLANAGLIASIALPAAAGFIEPQEGGTTRGIVAGGASGALTGAGFGASVGALIPVVGPIIGAIGGAIVGGLSGAISKSSKSFEELAQQIAEVNAKYTEQINSATSYIQIQQQINEAIAGGASDRQISTLLKQQGGVFRGISRQDREDIIGAGGDIEKLSEVLAKIGDRIDKAGRINDVSSALLRTGQNIGFFSGVKGKDIEASVDALANAIDLNNPKIKKGFDDLKTTFEGNPGPAFQKFAQILGIEDDNIKSILSKLSNHPKALEEIIERTARVKQKELTLENDIRRNFTQNQTDFSKLLTRSAIERSFASQIRFEQTGAAIRIQDRGNNALNVARGDFGPELIRRQTEAALATQSRLGAAEQEKALDESLSKLTQLLADPSKTILDRDRNQLLDSIKNRSVDDLNSFIELNSHINKDIYAAIQESVHTQKLIEAHTLAQLEETRKGGQIEEILSKLQTRNDILAKGRFSEDRESSFFNTNSNLRTKRLFRNQAGGENAALLAELDEQDSIFAPSKFANAIREAALEKSSDITIASKLSSVLGQKVEANEGSIIDAAKRAQSSTDKIAALVGTRALETIEQRKFNSDAAEDALKNISSGGVRSLLKTGDVFQTGFDVNARLVDRSNQILTTIAANTSNSALSKVFSQIDENRSQARDIEEERGLIAQRTDVKKRLENNNTETEKKLIRKALEGEDSITKIFGQDFFERNLFQDPDAPTQPQESRSRARSNIALKLFRDNKNTDPNELLNSDIFEKVAKANNQDPEILREFIRTTLISRGRELLKDVVDTERQALEESLVKLESRIKVLEDKRNNRPRIKPLENILENVESFDGNYGGPAAPFTSALNPASTGLPKAKPTIDSFGLANSTAFDIPIGYVPSQNRLLNAQAREVAANPGIIQRTLREDSVAKIDERATEVKLQIRNARDAGASQEELFRLQSELSDLLNSRLRINRRLTDVEANLDRAQRAYTDLVNKKAAGGIVTGQEIEDALTNRGRAKGLNGDSVGSFTDSFFARFKGYQAELQDFSRVGTEVADSLERNFTDAWSSFVTGASKGKDAFRGFLASVTADASRAFASKSIQNLFGAVLGNFTTARAAGGPIEFARGGMVPAKVMGGEYYFSPQAAKRIGKHELMLINDMRMPTARGYAGGGLIRGGSGYKDDIATNLPQDSFIVRKAAVQKYGVEYLNALASGRVQKKFWGGLLMGALVGGGVGYATGGKKGAVRGALIGGVAGGLAQNYAQSGNIFKTGSSGQGFFSFQGNNAMGGMYTGPMSHAPGPGYGTQIPTSGIQSAQPAFNWQSMVAQFGASAALGIGSALLQKNSEEEFTPWNHDQINAFAAKEEAEQRTLLNNRTQSAILQLNPQGGYSLLGFGEPSTRRFAEGGSASLAPAPDLAPLARYGEPSEPAMSVSEKSTNNVTININIDKAGNSTTETAGDNKDEQNAKMSERLGKAVKATVLEVLAEERRVGGSMYRVGR